MIIPLYLLPERFSETKHEPMEPKTIYAKKAKIDQAQAIYIHIGYPKTGTTSIQAYLRRYKKELFASNYHYLHSTNFDKSLEIPLIVAPEKCGYFVKQLHNRQVYHEDYRDRIIDEISSNIDEGKSIVISNEAFIARFNKVDHISILKSFISTFNIPVKIIVYLRRQDEFVSSIFSTQMRDGNIKHVMQDFAASKLPTYKYLDYSQLLRDWGAAFGKDNLIVKLYDKSKLINEDIIADFLSILDVPLNEKYSYDMPIKVNQSFSKTKILLLEHLSRAKVVDRKK